MPSTRVLSSGDESDGGVTLIIREAKKHKKEKKGEGDEKSEKKKEKSEKKLKKGKKEKKELSKDNSSTKEKSSKKRKAETLAEPIVVATSPEADISMDDAAPVEEKSSSNPPSKKRKSVLDGEEIEVDVTAPEPPSKKALRALKKGKPLPPSKSGAEPTKEAAEAKKAKAKAEVEKRSEHGVWIGNLAFHTSKTDLRKFFVEKSDITDEVLTRIHMPGPNDKKSANHVEEKRNGKVVHNKGFAYVDFTTEEGVTEALELSEQLLGGRRVLIKSHKSFEGRPQKTKEETRKEGKPPSKRVFLGNLAFEATEEIVQTHFEKCGAIFNVKLAQFEDTGKCKGYGWIQFEEIEAAQNAVRGFVYVDEPASDDSSSESEPDFDEEIDSDVEIITKSKPKKKMNRRKVWCNRINGRTLRMEFAEDAQVRYKKRYGKDGTKQQQQGSMEEARPVSNVVVPSTTVEYRQPYAARLTGGIVESKGKKMTF